MDNLDMATAASEARTPLSELAAGLGLLLEPLRESALGMTVSLMSEGYTEEQARKVSSEFLAGATRIVLTQMT